MGSGLPVGCQAAKRSTEISLGVSRLSQLHSPVQLEQCPCRHTVIFCIFIWDVHCFWFNNERIF